MWYRVYDCRNFKRNGITIGDNILIGSFAIKRNVTLVTNNTKFFVNLKGIHLDNWVN